MDDLSKIEIFECQGFSKEQAIDMYKTATMYAKFIPTSIEKACKMILSMCNEFLISGEDVSEMFENNA
ncbi:MAG: hypothetical protein RR370_04095 [Synergistaceae bacterium]